MRHFYLGNNFRLWTFQITCALETEGIDISKAKPEVKSTHWLKDDGMTMSIATSSMDNTNRNLLNH